MYLLGGTRCVVLPLLDQFYLTNHTTPSLQISSPVPPHYVYDDAMRNHGVVCRSRRPAPPSPHPPIRSLLTRNTGPERPSGTTIFFPQLYVTWRACRYVERIATSMPRYAPAAFTHHPHSNGNRRPRTSIQRRQGSPPDSESSPPAHYTEPMRRYRPCRPDPRIFYLLM
jgi:hypothetical protein